MNTIFYAIESLLYSLNLLIISDKIYKISINKKGYLISSLLLHTLLCVAGFFIDLFLFACLLIGTQFSQIVLLKLFSIKHKLLGILETYVLIYCFGLILSVSVSLIFTFKDDLHLIVDFLINIILFVLVAILSFSKTFAVKIRTVLNILPQSNKHLMLLSCIVNGIFLALLSSNPLFNDNSAWSTVIRMFSILASVLLFTLLPILLATSLSNLFLREQNNSFQRELEAQAKYYSEKAKSDFELRRFKHDFNNLKIGVKKALEMNNTEAVAKLLYNDEYDTEGEFFDTGNGIADAILSEKQEIGRTSSISIRFIGSFPSDKLSPSDLCILLGNTLDNAIEACKGLPTNEEKIISVESRYSCGFMFLTITNPTADEVKIIGNTVQTTKDDLYSHGFGLYSLNKVVKNYNGELSLECKNHVFSVKIDLCI